MKNQLTNTRVKRTTPLPLPDNIIRDLPLSLAAEKTVAGSRQAVIDTLHGKDKRLMVIVGPCSIHNTSEALEYSAKLSELARKVHGRILIVMRCYFEKPRTTIGWKGLINDPDLNGSFDINKGYHTAREFLLKTAEMGLPACTEYVETITPQYIGDLISVAAIGARTTEGQIYRQLASGLSTPVGFKNGTDGSVQIAVDATVAAAAGHSFPGIDGQARGCAIETTGNPDTFVILRGGRSGPNYDSKSISSAAKLLKEKGKDIRLVVDCSHDNSGKNYRRQKDVFNNLVKQILAGNKLIGGIMLESNQHEGAQKLSDPKKLEPGVSITDECIGWKETEELMMSAFQQLDAI